MTPVLVATIAAVGLVVALILWLLPEPRTVPPAPILVRSVQRWPIASAGEWVTKPDGSRVCRLRASIVRGITFTPGLCEEWQGPIPQWAQTVPWLRLSPGAMGTQIMVEGEWRP